MYGWHMQSWGGGGWLVMALMMLVFWTVVIVGVVALVRHFAPRDIRSTEGSVHDARKILTVRLARGEIDEAEFNKLTEILAREVR